MSRLRAEVTMEIGVAVGDVFTGLCEAETWPMWTRWASHVTVEPPGPIRGGSVVHVGRRGGLHRRTAWQVTDLRPDRLIALEREADRRRMWLHLEPAGGTTTVTVRLELRSGGLLPFLRRRSEESAVRADLRRLKSLLESPAGVAALLTSRPTRFETDAIPATSLEAARRRR